jgi:hypothetical protein
MKSLFILACVVATFSGCASSRQYSSVSEPAGGTHGLDPIVSTPRNWNKPVKSAVAGRSESTEGGRVVQGTSWERTWHGE